MKRRARLRSKVRPGRARSRRVAAGGKLAVGRPAATKAEWEYIKAKVFVRATGRCEVTYTAYEELPSGPRGAVYAFMGDGTVRCKAPAIDPCHVRNRSQGCGDSEDEVFAGCRPHHDQMDWPYAKGKLVARALGGGRFEFRVMTARDKFAARAAGLIGGRDGAAAV